MTCRIISLPREPTVISQRDQNPDIFTQVGRSTFSYIIIFTFIDFVSLNLASQENMVEIPHRNRILRAIRVFSTTEICRCCMSQPQLNDVHPQI